MVMRTPPIFSLVCKDEPSYSILHVCCSLGLTLNIPSSIGISSLKTWEAVVDSSDQSQARKHMFLWLLTLAGLSLEPIVDSVLGQRFPLYEGLKIVVSGWLVLSHFYISKPRNEGAEHGMISESAQSNYNHRFTAPNRDHESGIHLSASDQGNSLSTGANYLDFGRFKRDLERRKKHGSTTSRSQQLESPNVNSSRASSILPQLQRTESASRQSVNSNSTRDDTFTKLLKPSTLGSSRINSDDAGPEIIRANALVNPFTIPSASNVSLPQSRTIRRERNDWESSGIAQNSSSLGTFEFGAKPHSLKRPLSAVLSSTGVPRSGKDIRALLSRASPQPPASTRQSRISRPRRIVSLNYDQSPRYSHDPEVASNNGSGSYRTVKRKRIAKADDVQQQQSDYQTNSKTDKSHTSGNVAPSQRIQQNQLFSKPKPPGRNRTGILRQQTLPKEPTEERGAQSSKSTNKSASTVLPPRKQHVDHHQVPGSASLEHRMSSVREWVKDKDPSLISPPLSTNSDAVNNSTYDRPSEEDKGDGYEQQIRRQYLKRKAHRQLAPIRDLKRPARTPKQPVDSETRRRGGEGEAISSHANREASVQSSSSIYPQPLDSISIPVSLRQQAQQSRPTHVPVSAPQRPYSVTKQDSQDDQGDHEAEAAPFSSPVDWSRFQKPVQTFSSPKRAITSTAPWISPLRRRHQPVLSSSQASSSRTFEKSPTRSHAQSHSPFSGSQTNTNIIAYNKDSGLSPLVKLRHTQLKQRQKEDFLGIKRKQNTESDDLFQFNQTLDVWERGDDETLARNAALEAEAIEASMSDRQTWDQVREVHPGKFSVLGAPVIEESRPISSIATQPAVPRYTRANSSSIRHLSSSLASASPQPSFKNNKPVVENLRSPASGNRIISSPRRRLSNNFGSNSSSGSVNFARPERNLEILGTVSSSSPFRSSTSIPPTPKRNMTLRRSLLGEFASAATEEESAVLRRERHPGLFTPSKKDRVRADLPTLQETERVQSNQRSPHKSSTPILSSRYIEVSPYPDDDNEDDDSEDEDG
ncbi:hypothetical protein BGW38_000155 [Lunasporangiospora selenospora]|uniref:Uncharacterized protein n=1 Tax=Lunasporangiospora selenospora TaxID=979761 RepID=A0A9P6FW25_9FUNG|nr:hypothetical protein BGW38_000155 [Lunasporangiospora selenospora]